MALFPLCRIDQLTEGECKEFEVPTTAKSSAYDVLEIFLVKRQQQIYGYRNQCPHTGVTLNWLANQFMDSDNHYLQCATHGALFRVEDGYCVRGPCAGESLTRIDIITRERQLFLQWDDSDEAHTDDNIPHSPELK